MRAKLNYHCPSYFESGGAGIQMGDETMAATELSVLLKGYSLTTAEILYRLPDHPALLQSYIWQDYDLHPRFPKLKGFLDFWSTELEGELYKVTIAHRKLLTPTEVRLVGTELKVH
jgi:uncharacterized protein Usg